MIRDGKKRVPFSNLLYRISYSTIFRSSNIFFHCYCIMHKSALTFGLLMSSLVMLAIVPFLNNNNPAMAQGYYDENSYSQYPTDDKKYECRTGPFEGFFVSSVEFCKHIKFDDNKRDHRDNKIGPQGTPGPQGPKGDTGATGATGSEGIQGLQGPAGPIFLNTSNVYLNQSTVHLEPNFGTYLEALCDDGDFVVNGGYFVNIITGGEERVFLDGPITGPSEFSSSEAGSGWAVSAFVIGGIGSDFTVSAFCFDNPPLR
jgi:hypothetical protein